MNNNIFAVDIGGSKLMCGVIEPNGHPIETVESKYPAGYTIDTVIALIKENFDKLKHHCCSVCGVAVPGLCDYKSGEWLYSPFSGIGNIPIAQIIGDITGMPVFADNDVNISAIAEKYFGVCKDVSDFLWVTVSNGIGGGLYLENKLYRGQNLNAGEVGHFIVEQGGRKCGCGNNGCLEALASGASIAAIYNEKTGQNLSAKDIADLARGGDETALQVWQSAGSYIGKAASYAVNLLVIDTVVLGGGAAEAFDLLQPSAQKTLNSLVFKKANPNAKILHSSLARQAALLGCAALTLENTKNKM